MVSEHPGFGSDPPIGSDRRRGATTTRSGETNVDYRFLESLKEILVRRIMKFTMFCNLILIYPKAGS